MGCVRHLTTDIIGTLPTSISIEFKSEVTESKIEDIKDYVKDVISKYFSDFDVEIDSFDEFGIDLDLELNLTGVLDYVEATREEPAEEGILWNEDYESLLEKLRVELMHEVNYESVSIYENSSRLEIYPAA